MEFSVNQIASLVDGTVEGNGDEMINAFSKIEEGKKGAISFLANPKYSHYVYTTESSAVLVRKDFVAEHPVKATLIRVEDPYETIARLLSMASAVRHPVGIEQPCHIAQGVELPQGTYVGAFACIGRGVRLGRDVKIYPQSYVGEDVTIGEGTVIYAGVKIYHGCRIGARCIIHSGAVIGADGFGFAPSAKGYEKIPQIGNVEISDDVEIGANTTIDRATMGSTRVKRGVKLDNLIQVAHNVEIGENTVMAAQVGIAGSTKIGNRCMIGGQTGFAGHIKVGDAVRVGAQSGIPSNVADNSSIIGYPATDAKDFARQSVYVKNLGKLNRRVDELEKSIKGKK